MTYSSFFASARLMALLAVLFCWTVAPVTSGAQIPDEFAYEGYLEWSQSPANGSFDFRFSLFDRVTGGTQIGQTLDQTLSVTDGVFATTLDFGDVFDGTRLYLEIQARRTGLGSFITLTPRMQILPVPYAVQARALTLPFSGSTDATGAAIEVSNSAYGGDGFGIPYVGRRGVHVGQAGVDGVIVERVGESSEQIPDEERLNGFEVWGAQDYGLYVGHANTGVRIMDASTGMYIQEVYGTGVNVAEAGTYGFRAGYAEAVGVEVFEVGEPRRTLHAGDQNGVRIWGVEGNGVGIGYAGQYGVYINEAGTGIRIDEAYGDGIYVGAAGGYAANLHGKVRISGNLYVDGTVSKGGGSFQIDHPLDPENKYLYHSFVESPDMMNVYNGNIMLNEKGEAEVVLPDYFETLNRDFRYQLTAVGAPGPGLFIAEKVDDNRFTIAGGTPGMEVSWQITGVRQDPYAELHRIQVEVDKPAAERGTYLHPDAYGQPSTVPEPAFQP